MLQIGQGLSYIIGFLVIAVTSYLMYMRWIRSHYPDGPWPLPIIGNLHLLSSNTQLGLAKLAKKYGPVFTFWMGNTPLVVVSNRKLWSDAMLHKGDDFDGKALGGFFLEVLTHQHEDLVTRSNDEKRKLMHKMVVKFLRPGVLTQESVQSIVAREVQELLKSLLVSNGRPLDAQSSLHDCVCRVIGRVTMSLDDVGLKEWQTIIKKVHVGLEKSQISSFYPIFWYLQPGITSILKDVSSSLDKFLEMRLYEHERTYKEGCLRDLMDVMIKAKKETSDSNNNSCKISPTNICLLMADVLVAGQTPVIDTVLWCLLVLLKRPDIQKSIRSDLDHLAEKKIQNGLKIPIFNGKPFIEMSDREELVNLQAFIYETIRLFPAAAISIPHYTIRSTMLGEYNIPSGTSVAFNYFAINRDERLWKMPLEIQPERFINDEGRLDLSEINKVISFSQGKRMCAGENLAKTVLTLILSNILLNFELSCQSVETLPTYKDGVAGVSFSPKDFEIKFKERK